MILELVQNLGLSRRDITRIIDTAPARYKVYRIAKRGTGFRTIAQPSRELKAVQRYILYSKLSTYDVHSSAMAYVKNRSISTNATSHSNADAILKLDFRDFFPSIKVGDWERFARKNPNEKVELTDLPLYSRIMFWGEQKGSGIPRCLSIGAPTSPAVSNILLFDLDNTLDEIATSRNLKYTRYADDMTISGGSIEVLREFEQRAYRAVKSLKSPRLSFNEEKRGIFCKSQRRMVTGLVITPENRVSIGRERKRLISAMLNRVGNGIQNVSDQSHLKGLLGFCIANEPEFVSRMRAKYGDEIVNKSLKFRAPKRDTTTPPGPPFVNPPWRTAT